MAETTPTKQYFVQLPDEETGQTWDEAKFNRNKDQLFNDFTDAMVFETSPLGADEALTEGSIYAVHDPDTGETQQWDGARLARNREQLMKDIPNVQITRATPVNYWGDKLTENYNRREQLQQELQGLPQEVEGSELRNMDDGDIMTYATRQVSPQAKRRREIQRELEQLNVEREKNPAWQKYWQQQVNDLDKDLKRIGMRKQEAQWRINEGDTQSLMDPEILDAARNLLEDARKTAAAPSKYDDSLANAWKGIRDTGWDAVSFVSLAKSLGNINLIEAVQQIQRNEGEDANVMDLVQNHLDEMTYLSKPQRELVRAFVRKAEVESGRSDNLSRWYQAGQGFAHSLGFMADFALAGGLGEAAADRIVGKGISGAAKAAGETTLKKIGAESLYGAVKAAAMTPLLPSTYSNILDNITRFDDEGGVDLSGKAVLKAVGDAAIETISETIGSEPLKLLGWGASKVLPTDWIGKTQFGAWAKALRHTPVFNAMKQAGWNGFVEEMFEEVSGNALRVWSGIDKDALKDFMDPDQLLITAASFAPMSILGGVPSTVQYSVASRKMKKAGVALQDILRATGIEAPSIDVSDDATPEALGAHIGEMYREAVNRGANPTATFNAAQDYAAAAANYKTLEGIFDEQKGIDRARQTMELDAQLGIPNWNHEGADGQRYVRTLTGPDGQPMYVTGEDENGLIIAVDQSGAPHYVNQEGIADGVYKDSGEVPLNEYLDNSMMQQRQAAEQQRMDQEQREASNQLAQLAYIGKPDLQIGTEEQPATGTIVSFQGGEYIVQSNEDGTIHNYTPEQMGAMVGVNMTPKTDEQIEQEQVDEIEISDENRERINAALAGDIIDLDNFRNGIPNGSVASHVIKMDDGTYRLAYLDPSGQEQITDVSNAELAELAARADVVLSQQTAETEVQPAVEAETELPAELSPEEETNLWNEDPAKWAAWNDRNRQDGGADSIAYIQAAAKAVEGAVNKAQKQYGKELDFGKRRQLADDVARQTQRLDQLNGILADYQRRAEAAQRAELARQKAAEAEKNAPRTPVELAAAYITDLAKAGGLRGKLNREDFARELGREPGDEEMKKFFSWWAKEGQGKTVYDLAEDMAKDYDTYGIIPMADNADQKDIEVARNAIIELFNSSSLPSEITNLIAQNREAEEEDLRASEAEARDNTMDTGETLSGGQNDTATLQDTVSDNRDSEISEETSTPSENLSQGALDFNEEIEQARQDVDTNPSDAQKEAGNYKKGHVTIDGYDISIENPKGSVRSGTDADGNPWSVTMNNDYGYIRMTEGVDGDHIDVFLSDNPTEGNVFVVDQVNPQNGEFDEHKVMYGFPDAESARAAYLANYSPGWKGLGTITEVSKDEFKKWIDSSHRKTKPFSEYKSVKPEGAQNEGQSVASRAKELAKRIADLEKKIDEMLEEWLESDSSEDSRGQKHKENFDQRVELRRQKRLAEQELAMLITGASEEDLAELEAADDKGIREIVSNIKKEEAVKNYHSRISAIIHDEQKVPKVKAKPLGKFKPEQFLAPKGDARVMMTGTFHDTGYAVSSDATILVADKETYDKKHEGKVIARAGNEIAGKYPKWREILPFENSFKEKMDFSKLRDFLAGVRQSVEEEFEKAKERGVKATKKEAIEHTKVILNLDTNVTAAFWLGKLSAFVDYAERIGAKELSFIDDRRAVGVKTSKGIAILMPIQLDYFETVGESDFDRAKRLMDFSTFSYGTNEYQKSISKKQAVESVLAYIDNKTPEQIREEQEQRRQQPLRDRIKEWEERTGQEIEVIGSFDEIKEQSVRMQVYGDRTVKGWFNPSTNKVVVYLPNTTDISDIDKTYLHEIISHKGLRELLGQDGFNVLMDHVYADVMTDADRQRYAEYNRHLRDGSMSEEQLRRADADEYVAHLAENMDADPSAWQKFVALFKEALMKLGLNIQLTDQDLSALLHASLARYESMQRNAREQERARMEAQQQRNEDAAAFVSGERTKAADTAAAEKNPQVPISETQEKYEDFGEKIGWAKKDLAKRGYTQKKGEGDASPAWRKKYVAVNIEEMSESDKAMARRFGLRTDFQEVPMDVTAKEPDYSKPFVGYYVKKSKAKYGRDTKHYITGEDRKPIIFTSQDQYEATIPVFEAKDQGYRVRQDGDKFKIVRPASNGKMVEYAEFDSREDAVAYLASPEGCTDLLNRKRENYELPALEELTRNNMPDYRNGKNITPDDFQKMFKFRGGEFGNWENAAERQQALNYAYDALMDLAMVLGVTPESLSLNGELSIAFGARGEGGARAHYEPTKAVINLTKMKGAGSLAHEWAHALDNYFGLMDAKQTRNRDEDVKENQLFLSEGSSWKKGARQEVRDAFAAVMKAIKEKTVTRQIALDKAQKEYDDMIGYARRQLQRQYREEFARGITKYQYNRKTKQRDVVKIVPTEEQLAEYDRLSALLENDPTFKFDWDYTKSAYRASGDVAKQLYDLVKDVMPNRGGEKYGPLHNAFYYLDKALPLRERLEKAKAGETETVSIPTTILEDSRWFDRMRAGEYYAKDIEMFARAFENYVSGEMRGEGQSSDYLTYEKGPLYQEIWDHNPYPAGEERASVKMAFDHLFDVLQEKVDAQTGRTMLFRKDGFAAKEGNVYFRKGRSLVGMHNISENKLAKAMKTGGLANPSAAVVDIARQNHEDYGEISLIMPSALVDSETGRNIGTFLGDAWTPTYPGTQKIMSDAGWDKLFADLRTLPDEVRSTIRLDYDLYLEDDRMADSLKWWFLHDTGRNPEIVKHESGLPEATRDFILSLGDRGDEAIENDREAFDRVADLFRQMSSEEEIQKAETKLEPREGASEFVKRRIEGRNAGIDKYGIAPANIFQFLNQLHGQLRREGSVNEYETFDRAARFIESENLQDEFQEWLDARDERYDAETKLFAGWTRDGEKKWLANTVENASRLMNGEPQQNAYGYGGLSATRASLVQRMRTLADIRRHKDLLVTPEEYDERYKELEDELFAAIQNLADRQKLSDNQFSNIDYAEARLQKALPMRSPAAYLNAEYGYSIPVNGEYAESLKQLKKDLRAMPAKYFETKFGRPVMLDEFAAAVVPSDIKEETRKTLTDAGLPLFEYDPKESGSRREATMKATEGDNILFRKAYHGSGASFDRFDHSHMGEGEGAQAHGWGTYVSFNEDTARGYAERSGRSMGYGDRMAIRESIRRLVEQRAEMKKSLQQSAERHANWAKSHPDASPEEMKAHDDLALKLSLGDVPFYQAIESAIRQRELLVNSMEYAVTYKHADMHTPLEEMETIADAVFMINHLGKADRETFLDYYRYDMEHSPEGSNLRKVYDFVSSTTDEDWTSNRNFYTVEIPEDTGLNYMDEQADAKLTDVAEVWEALSQVAEDDVAVYLNLPEFHEFNHEHTGKSNEYLYQDLARILGSQKEASKLLERIGYAGIKYDGRMDGPCAVIFNDQDVKIADHIRFRKAPNGAESNLTDEQWKMVRTPEFKRWFGDWEKDPQNASKIVDENGEPRVVEHATNADFTVFDISHLGENSHDKGLFGAGFYFGSRVPGWLGGSKNLMRVYLNIRKPFETIDGGSELGDIYNHIVNKFDTPALRKLILTQNGKSIKLGDYIDIVKSVDDEIAQGLHNDTISQDEDLQFYAPKDRIGVYRERLISSRAGEFGVLPRSMGYFIGEAIGSENFSDALRKDGYDGVVVNRGSDYKEYVVFDPNQIKSATENNGDYSTENPDIRFRRAFHGSPADFSEFEEGHYREGVGSFHRPGYYFASDEKSAKTYAYDRGNGAFLYEVELPDDDGSNYIHVFTSIPKSKRRELAEKIRETFPEKDIDVERKIVNKNILGEDLLGMFTNDELQQLGFVGIEGPMYIATMPQKQYVIFNPKDIKIKGKTNVSTGESIRFRRANEDQRIFISNAEKAVEDMKMDKATPEQWKKTLEKNGGLKAAEDKWLGLSAWLDGLDRKTVTKPEVLDFIAENQIQIEETNYSEAAEKSYAEAIESYQNEYRRLVEETGGYDAAFDAMIDRYGDDFDMAFERDGDSISPQESWDGNGFTGAAEYYLDQRRENRDTRAINPTRLDYTTEGLTNKREIALTVPTIEPWNEGDDVHFGDAGEGRAIAWARFGDTYGVPASVDKERLQDYGRMKNLAELDRDRAQEKIDRGTTGRTREQAELDLIAAEQRLERLRNDFADVSGIQNSKVLVIDEIQSKRHQEARERGGYKDESAVTVEYNNSTAGWDYYFNAENKGYISELIAPTKKEALELARSYYHGIPAAPFEKNWHELAMKRMLRLAAEEGYDYVAWTTGEQQAERYDIGHVIDEIWHMSEKNHFNLNKDGYSIGSVWVDDNGVITGGNRIFEGHEGEKLSEFVGKDVAIKMMASKPNDEIKVNGLVGGEGMKGFYDDILPRFMNKYGKKWGVKVEDIYLPNVAGEASAGLPEGLTMHAVPVTPEMKESVMQGQLMFRRDGIRGPGEGSEEVAPDGGRYSPSPVSHSQSTEGKRDAATKVAAACGIEIEFKPSAEMQENGKALAGRWENGKMYICPEHCRDAEDAIRTVLHEGVGHNGLRRLIGNENMQAFCMDVYRRLPESARKEIADAAVRKYGANVVHATEEYLARKAETIDYSDQQERTFWDTVREALRKVLAKIGIDVPLSERDIRWLMWQSYNANKQSDILNFAKRQVVANRLGFTLRKEEYDQDGIETARNREAVDAEISGASRAYNFAAQNVWKRLKESFVDQYTAINDLVSAIEKESGRKAASFEDIRLALNQQGSKALAKMNDWIARFNTPMWDEIKAVMKKAGCDLSAVERYVMLKHGLERNEVFAKRDARAVYQSIHDNAVKKIQESDHEQYVKDEEIAREDAKLDRHFRAIENGTDKYYQEYRERDYGGLTGLYSEFDDVEPRRKGETSEEFAAREMAARHPMYDNVADMEAAARAEVADFEGKADTSELWKRINAATKETLRQQYEANIISRGQYTHVRDMFQYYVPLRGFSDKTAEDLYDYYNSDQRGVFTAPLQRAGGRTTKAESPFGFIAAAASSGIAQDMKNESKLALYYFISNRKGNDLVSVSEQWYEKVGEDEEGKAIFEPVYPPFNEDLSSEQSKRSFEDWEKSMREKARSGLAFKGRGKLDLSKTVVHINPESKKDHVIAFKLGGKDMMMYINGNPRAAQAINNELNYNAENNVLTETLNQVLRTMAALNTQLNPEFWISNFQRDALFALMSVSTKEGGQYAKDFGRNLVAARKVVKMKRAFEKGALGDTHDEQLYREFVENGGVTGYTVVYDNEYWERRLDEYAGKDKNLVAKAIDALKGVSEFGEAVEQMTRFAAFKTSREAGKDIKQSVADAKELTVNFNRKGSGKAISLEEAKKLTWANGRALNKVEQFLVSFISNLSPYGRRFIMFFNASIQGLNAMVQLYKKNPARAAMWSGGYFAVGMMNAILHALVDDDDDYLDIPDWERRNNLLLGVHGWYLKWALPQEARVFYGLGDMIVNHAMGRTPNKNIIGELLSSLGEVAPIDFPSGIGAFAPSAATPIVDIVRNKDYKGARVYNEHKYYTEEERRNVPAYRDPLANTGGFYVSLSKVLNALSGGDEYQAGKINWNPNIIEHLVEGYTGGTGTSVEKLFQFFGDVAGGELVVRNTPFLRRVLSINDERYRNTHTTELFYYYQDEASSTRRQIKEASKAGDDKKLDKLYDSREYEEMLVFESYKGLLKYYNDALKLTDDPGERKSLMREQDAIRKEMIQEISNIGK